MDKTSQVDLIFVYLGKKLPNYAKSAIYLATKHSGLNVKLIGNQSIYRKYIFKNYSNLNFIAIESFYDNKNFMNLVSKISSPHEFRDGFWLKTLERFFVLSQYMKKFNKENIFHAELDQLLFGCDELITNIQNIKLDGLFIPFHTTDKVVASVVYCNEIEALDSFIEYCSNENSLENEMNLLATWAKNNTGFVHPLPTLATRLLGVENFSKLNLEVITADQVGGITDAAQLGQWVGGEDPRNISFSGKPKNKFHEKANDELVSQLILDNLNFKLSSQYELYVEISNQKSIRLYNLHLHSKIHKWLAKKPKNLMNLFAFLAETYALTLPMTRRIQLIYLFQTGVRAFADNPSDSIKRYWNLKPSKTK